MKRSAVFLLTLLLAVWVAGCKENAEAEKASQGRAPSFEIKDTNGNLFRLSDHSGKVIILNFFATWCPPCRMEMPDFNEIAKEYKGKVEIVGINVGKENVSTVEGFRRQNNLEFTIAMDDGRVSALYGGAPMIPVTVIIDKNFNIARRYVGARTKADFVKDIEELLK